MNRPQVITFGCRLNTVESEVMANRAVEAGLNDAIIVNTCAVTNEAVRQARQAIRKAHRANPNIPVVVGGCAAQLSPEQFADMPEVSLVLGNEEKLQAASYAPSNSGDFGIDALEKIRVNDIDAVHETAGHLIEGFADRSRAFVQIQNGCDHRCTFCIIPFARGPSRSVPMGAVVEQIKKLVGNGYEEAVLTGVDITSYGDDLPGNPSLGALCQKILQLVPDLPRLRLSSIDSVEVDEPLFEVIASEHRLMPHLHLSLQAGDNMILKRMKRRHLREDSIAFCDSIRAARPDVVFGADLITGFPTETDAMFENTVKLVEEAGLTFLHVFPFSARPGTPAAKMAQLPGDIRRGRAAVLRMAGDKARNAFFQSQIGETVAVLVEKTENNIDTEGSKGIGHTPHFAPIEVVNAQPGIVDVRVTAAAAGGLTGILAE
jgi:threonylcarbamoyladenosine tRNA methylthiotransferase MtaB